jgi:hypothetical protein
MACGNCARICDKAFCYRYSMMDYDVTQQLLAKKETLDTADDAQRLTFVCEQVYVDDWDAYYAVCDLHFVAFGPKPA